MKQVEIIQLMVIIIFTLINGNCEELPIYVLQTNKDKNNIKQYHPYTKIKAKCFISSSKISNLN